MSISDHLDKIERDFVEANEQWDCGRSAFNANNHAPPIDVALANSELMLDALRAVLDMHSRDYFGECAACPSGIAAPCPTVSAIEAALGEES